MPYLGQKLLSETAPNHPFARMQIRFDVKRPASSKRHSRAESAPEECTVAVAPKPEAQT